MNTSRNASPSPTESGPSDIWPKMEEARLPVESDERQEIQLAPVGPLIDRFFQTLSREEWEMMRIGHPDEATKLQLAQLILDIIVSLSQSLLENLKRKHVAVLDDQIRSTLGDIVPQSFAQALNLSHSVSCSSSRGLTDLIVKEVSDSVRSSLEAGTNMTVQREAVAPKRLNKMIKHTSKMVKKFTKGMKTVCKRPGSARKRQKSTTAAKVESDHQEETDKFEIIVVEDGSQLHPSSLGSKNLFSTSEEPDNALETATTRVMEEIIRKEFEEISDALVEGMEGATLQEEVMFHEEVMLLKADASTEVQDIAEAAAESIIEEVISREVRDAGSTTCKKEKTAFSLKEVFKNVHTFFATHFAKLSIHCAAETLRRKFSRPTKVESKGSKKSLHDSIDSLISTIYMEHLEDLTKASAFPTMIDFTQSNLAFSENLSALLHEHATGGMMPELTPEPPYCREVQLKLVGDIQASVWRFLSLMRWWLTFQARTHSDRVVQSLSESEHLTTLATKSWCVAKLTLDDKANAEFKATAVRVLVEMLVTKVFSKAKVNYSIVCPETIVSQLYSKIWAKVNAGEYKVTPQNFSKIQKDIFKDLEKKLKSGVLWLILLNMNHEDTINYIVNLFQTSMLPKKPSTCCRFFKTIRHFFSRK